MQQSWVWLAGEVSGVPFLPGDQLRGLPTGKHTETPGNEWHWIQLLSHQVGFHIISHVVCVVCLREEVSFPLEKPRETTWGNIIYIQFPVQNWFDNTKL